MAEKKKKNIAEKIKKFSESIQSFIEGSQKGDTFIIGKQKKYGEAAKEKKANGGLISGKPKLAKKGWK